jgi:hypothetical protein
MPSCTLTFNLRVVPNRRCIVDMDTYEQNDHKLSPQRRTLSLSDLLASSAAKGRDRKSKQTRTSVRLREMREQEEERIRQSKVEEEKLSLEKSTSVQPKKEEERGSVEKSPKLSDKKDHMGPKSPIKKEEKFQWRSPKKDEKRIDERKSPPNPKVRSWKVNIMYRSYIYRSKVILLNSVSTFDVSFLLIYNCFTVFPAKINMKRFEWKQ